MSAHSVGGLVSALLCSFDYNLANKFIRKVGLVQDKTEVSLKFNGKVMHLALAAQNGM